MNQKFNIQVTPNIETIKKSPENIVSKDRISIQTKDKVEAAKSFIESNFILILSFYLTFFHNRRKILKDEKG